MKKIPIYIIYIYIYYYHEKEVEKINTDVKTHTSDIYYISKYT